ncbi:MAG: DedA family protein [Candidatus Micrarchaeaceae archaeon]
MLALSLNSIIHGSVAAITSIMEKYGYAAIFGLMALESSSIPVPSEVIMPLAGLLSSKGILSFPLAFAASLLGSLVGLAVDYYIGYYLGKDVVYRHLRLFHISKEQLDAFDAWFKRNGAPAVLITRMLPVVRTVMSFPAGFAQMDKKKFFGYSLSGSAVWNIVLMLFGFYALSSSNAVYVLTSMGIFALALYIIYVIAIRKLKASAKKIA